VLRQAVLEATAKEAPMPDVATIDLGPVDHILAAHRGVRGWLDVQDKLQSRAHAQFTQILAPTETQLDLAFANALEAGKFATATEIKVREDHRQALLGGADRPARLSRGAARFNEQGIRSAQRALKIVGATIDRLDDENSQVSRLRRVHEDPEVRAAIDEGRESFLMTFVKFNGLAPEDFDEVQKIWDEVIPIATDSGVSGLLEYTQSNIQQFIEVRGEDDRGNRPHSPLAWWKWVLIAWLVSSSIFAIIACFVWSGCSWVWGALGVVAGVIWQIIDRGC
jgi:hypothetical protein